MARHIVACRQCFYKVPQLHPVMTGERIIKERIAQSRRARAGSLATSDSPPQVARTCILQADVVSSFSGVTLFVLFCFVFVFLLSLKPRPFVRSFFDIMHPDNHTQLSESFFCLYFFFFCFCGAVFFPSIFVPLPCFS